MLVIHIVHHLLLLRSLAVCAASHHAKLELVLRPADVDAKAEDDHEEDDEDKEEQPHDEPVGEGGAQLP